MNEKDIAFLIGEISGKIDALSQQNINQYNKIISLENKVEAKYSDLDKRLQNLERYRAWLIGVSSAVAAIVSWLVQSFKGS